MTMSDPPKNERLEDMRSAAGKVTNDVKSIKVKKRKSGKYHQLITRFTMKTAAQYKVVDEIFDAFKLMAEDYGDYQDMAVRFPR